jgi:serine/threonine protein kinase
MFKLLGIYSSSISKDINDLYQTIQKHMKHKTLLPKYFGMDSSQHDTKNSYLQKSDIYSLGIAMFEFVFILTENSLQLEKQPKLKDLFMNMITIDPDKRFNVDQCLKHSYFN